MEYRSAGLMRARSTAQTIQHQQVHYGVRGEMAMAGALVLGAPCTVAIADPARRIGCKSEQENVGTSSVNRRAVDLRIAENHGSCRAFSSSCGGLLSCGHRRFRNSQLGWRSSSHFLGLDGFRFSGSSINVLALRTLVRVALRIAAEKIDPNNVIATLVKIGKQGLEAGTKLVPDSVPRPVAQAGVGLAGLVVGSFVLRSLFSTLFFVLAVGGLSYVGFFYLTKGEGSPSGSTFDKGSGKAKSTEEALEEARKIMDKYK